MRDVVTSLWNEAQKLPDPDNNSVSITVTRKGDVLWGARCGPEHLTVHMLDTVGSITRTDIDPIAGIRTAADIAKGRLDTEKLKLHIAKQWGTEDGGAK